MELTKTQESILKAARDLILSKGYPATTVDEIVDQAGVSKGSFYHAFPSKEEMGISLLEWYQLSGVAKVMGGPFAKMNDPKKRMFGFLDHIENISEDMWGQGCLLGNLGLELAETNPKIRKKVSGLFRKVITMLEPLFEPAGSKKGTKERPTSKEVAEQYMVMLEGSIMLARVYNDWGYFTRGLQNFRNQLQYLSS
jgi:TetR/AcrR family transcriptional repressor of nem operon